MKSIYKTLQEVVASHSTKITTNLGRGQRIGKLAYLFISFRLFENYLSLFALNKIANAIGKINHSEQFLNNLANPCYTELHKRLRTNMNQDLPCTGHERHITLLTECKRSPPRRSAASIRTDSVIHVLTECKRSPPRRSAASIRTDSVIHDAAHHI